MAPIVIIIMKKDFEYPWDNLFEVIFINGRERWIKKALIEVNRWPRNRRKFFSQAQFASYRVLILHVTTSRFLSRGRWTVFHPFLEAWVDGIFWTFFKTTDFLCQMYGNRNA